MDAIAKRHDEYATDNLADPDIDPYEVGKKFTYYPRWTNDHFAFFRTVVRAMCMDAGDELKAAWERANLTPRSQTKQEEGDPDIAWEFQLPTLKLTGKDGQPTELKVTWRNAPDLKNFEPVEVSRAMMLAYRDQYAKVQ
jgi:hypothetical protein